MAIGIAREVKELFRDEVELIVDTIHSKRAKEYGFKTSTNVLIDGERLPIKLALNKNKVIEMINKKLGK